MIDRAKWVVKKAQTTQLRKVLNPVITVMSKRRLKPLEKKRLKPLGIMVLKPLGIKKEFKVATGKSCENQNEKDTQKK